MTRGCTHSFHYLPLQNHSGGGDVVRPVSQPPKDEAGKMIGKCSHHDNRRRNKVAGLKAKNRADPHINRVAEIGEAFGKTWIDLYGDHPVPRGQQGVGDGARSGTDLQYRLPRGRRKGRHEPVDNSPIMEKDLTVSPACHGMLPFVPRLFPLRHAETQFLSVGRDDDDEAFALIHGDDGHLHAIAYDTFTW